MAPPLAGCESDCSPEDWLSEKEEVTPVELAAVEAESSMAEATSERHTRMRLCVEAEMVGPGVAIISMQGSEWTGKEEPDLKLLGGFFACNCLQRSSRACK